MTLTYITPQAYEAAAELFSRIQNAKKALESPQSLADKMALKRTIVAMQEARRTILEAIEYNCEIE